MGLEFEPSSEPLHNSAKQLFLSQLWGGVNLELHLSVRLSEHALDLLLQLFVLPLQKKVPAPTMCELQGYLAHQK